MLPFSKTVIDVESPSGHVLLSKTIVLNDKSLPTPLQEGSVLPITSGPAQQLSQRQGNYGHSNHRQPLRDTANEIAPGV